MTAEEALMIRTRILLVVVLLAAGMTVAAEPDAASELAALQAQCEASKLGYAETYKAFKPKFEAFAKKHAGTEEALTAKLWLLEQTWWLRESGGMEDAARALADEILAKHGDSPQLGAMAEAYFVFAEDDLRRVLNVLSSESPHPQVRASAMLWSARRWRGPESKEVLRTLIEEYGDVPSGHTTFGEVATAVLDPHPPEALAIGQPAPDISGVDSKGQRFRLSDYRGKVVVLDFWGDW
jgi:hypothetical protein